MFAVTFPTPAGFWPAAGHRKPPPGLRATMGLLGDAALPPTMIWGAGTLVTMAAPRRFVRFGARCTHRIREIAAFFAAGVVTFPTMSATDTPTDALPPPVFTSRSVSVAVEKFGVKLNKPPVT